MNDLVTLTSQRLDATAYTTSDIIADNTGINRRSLKRTIQNHIKRLERFGKVGTVFTPLSSGQTAVSYQLNERQTMLLFFYLSHTPQVEKFQERLVNQFTVMKRDLILRQAKFELGKEFSKSLHAAISESPALGEHGHLYININKLVYKQALGVNVNELRKARNIPKTEAITHYLSASEADAVKRVKQQIKVLLGMKHNYQQIKADLQIQGVVYQIRLTLPAKTTIN
ncbi:phage regulatory protein [Lactiplantibacillus garii]|uniref:Phage regulatory protein n=1 Tax=Lactiplantibacillus garii TaxID=2306423 RepID=A0A3R8KCM8_9LACO|nr:Rha family transcriptional regulator [Lactiplantibacillus garii]RRK09355.1 phage regulatory protein [Lactiplantibacillus garii]